MKGIRSIILALTLVLIGAVICAGCISTETKYQETVQGSWALDSDKNVTIFFGPEGVNGQAPINLYVGSYTVDGDKLTFGDDIITTMMAGTEEMMKAESEFFTALKNTAGWKIVDGNLVFNDAAGETLLTFVPTVLGNWDGEDGTSITFNDDGTFSGHAIINSFGGSFTEKGGKLTFEHTYVTEMAGSSEDMKAEDAFFEALNKVAGFTVRGDQLILTDADGNSLLSFVQHISMSGEWVLADDSSVTINFMDETTVGGNAPVNHYSGTYSTHGYTITFGEEFTVTLMASSDEAMKAESEFFKALGATTQFSIEDGKLIFADENGKTLLTFERPALE